MVIIDIMIWCDMIVDSNIARIREELEDHEFVFVDGTIPTEPSDGLFH